MRKIIKSVIKKILFSYLRKENNEIKNLIFNLKIDLNILDIGATGGIQKKWNLIEEILNVSFVEANKNLCGQRDSNTHGIFPTWPSTKPVYQFQHGRLCGRLSE